MIPEGNPKAQGRQSGVAATAAVPPSSRPRRCAARAAAGSAFRSGETAWPRVSVHDSCRATAQGARGRCRRALARGGRRVPSCRRRGRAGRLAKAPADADAQMRPAFAHTAFSLGRVMPPCAPHGDLTDEALWTVACPACRVDGMPQPNRWSARTPLRKWGRPGR